MKTDLPLDVLLDMNEKLAPFHLQARWFWIDENRGDVEIVSTLDKKPFHIRPNGPSATDDNVTVDDHSADDAGAIITSAMEDYDRVTAPKTVDSTSDARTVNNVMRHGYRVLDDAEKAKMLEIKDMGLAFWELVDSLGSSRELSNAKTRIEEATMWATKHLTN